MPKFLVLQLRGVMQSWGTHTFEDFRPSSIFPTRSAVVGLLGACIGIEREDIEARENLNKSICIDVVSLNPHKIRKIEDFHTVLDARKVDGKPRKDAIISKREYLCDAHFLLFLSQSKSSGILLENIENAVRKPVFTPFLGRKSCPITEPLFSILATKETDNISAINDVISQTNKAIEVELLSMLYKTIEELNHNEKELLEKQKISSFTIYCESKLSNSSEYQVRDIPVKNSVRQFEKRAVHILSKEVANVPH